MWFGTDDGLNKYGGTNFTIYENDPNDITSISHNAVNTLIEDNKKNLWIGTAKGLNLYNREKDNFIQINDTSRNYDQLKNQYINTLYVTNNDIIWIGTLGIGLIIYDYRNSGFYYYPHSDTNINSNLAEFSTSFFVFYLV